MVTGVSQRVFLHVGLPKSGTTYLQAVLGKNKPDLKQRARLLYPGTTWGRQVDAVRDVRRMKLPPAQRASVAGAWDRLVAEVQDWPDDSVVSMEWLCMATPGQIMRIAKDLESAEVHVVFTVRDVGRTVPAAWQEFSQNRTTWRWPDFLEQVTGDDAMDTPAGKAFWGQQDMELLLRRWTGVIPADRVHVVTLPQKGADPAELWQRMAEVLGIDPRGYDLTDLGSNASLGMESAELMRRVNERLRELGTPVPVYNRVFKHKVAKKVLASRKGEEREVLLPGEYHDWARAKAEQQIRAIETSGAEVVGDLDELRPVLDASRAQAVAEEPSPEAVLEAAVHALVTVALDAPRRNKRAASTVNAVPHAPREGLLRRARLDWEGRVRGRSARELTAAALRRTSRRNR
jgi:hypothetical protein